MIPFKKPNCTFNSRYSEILQWSNASYFKAVFVFERHETSSGTSGLDLETERPVLALSLSRNATILSPERVALRDRHRDRTGLGN